MPKSAMTGRELERRGGLVLRLGWTFVLLLLAWLPHVPAQTPDISGAGAWLVPNSLASMVNDSDHIALQQVDHVSKDRKTIVHRKVADLKGKSPAGRIRHKILMFGGDPPEWLALLAWAEPGRTRPGLAGRPRRGDYRPRPGRVARVGRVGAPHLAGLDARQARPRVAYPRRSQA
jgi:hypothetical protein